MGCPHILSNTRYTTVNMPKAFTETLDEKEDYLACITRLYAPYGSVYCTALSATDCENNLGCYWRDGHCVSDVVYPQPQE